MGIGTNAFR